MDKDRQIRFLYPPLIFLCSIGLGVWFDKSDTISTQLKNLNDQWNVTGITIALIGSSLVLVLGFIIGTVTVFILRLGFGCFKVNYEAKLSDKSYRRIGSEIFKDVTDSIKNNEVLFGVTAFDHGLIPENVHTWIMRRWNAFIISCSCIVALISSLWVGSRLNISISCKWLEVTLIFTVIFIVQSYYSWNHTMRMIEFMTRVKDKH